MDYTPRRIIEYQTKLLQKAHEYEYQIFCCAFPSSELLVVSD
jgi:hypothetical protein